MTSYAFASGSAARNPVKPTEPPPPRPLTPEELANAVAARDFVRANMPELVPMIEQLVELRMIDGWRNVVSFERINPTS